METEQNRRTEKGQNAESENPGCPREAEKLFPGATVKLGSPSLVSHKASGATALHTYETPHP